MSKVTVRMYRQGLGDCFLLSFEQKRRTFHMLIDCGALNSKHYTDAVIKDVVRDVLLVTKGKIDVLALTHEHWDHISGFLQAKELFTDKTGCKVGAVWTAWTEDPTRGDVAQLKERFKKKKHAVRAAIERIPKEVRDNRLGAYRGAIGELFEFFGGVGMAEAGRTEEAWKIALGLGRNRYLDPKKAPIELAELPGVRVYCLGPPDDPELIKKRTSTRETYEKESRGMSLADSLYAALNADKDTHDAGLAQPFDAHFRIPVDEARTKEWFTSRYAFDDGQEDYWRSIDYDWLAAAGGLALHLDSYTNNTCLALAIEVGDKVLLFPGDAQVGNWESWEKLSWRVRDGAAPPGRARTVTSDDLLARTVLYKVGHHGSHNATLKGRGLEKMESPHLVAMIPVHRDTAEDQKWEFPYKPLWTRLKERARGRVLLADSHTLEDISQDLNELSEDERAAFQAAVTHERLCVKYVLEV